MGVVPECRRPLAAPADVPGPLGSSHSFRGAPRLAPPRRTKVLRRAAEADYPSHRHVIQNLLPQPAFSALLETSNSWQPLLRCPMTHRSLAAAFPGNASFRTPFVPVGSDLPGLT